MTKLEPNSRGWLLNLCTLYQIVAVLLFFGAASTVRAQDAVTQGSNFDLNVLILNYHF
jgi:hypothetical protein